ncbi:hypothetical protein Mal52_52480 [Symmachiella dynata]|uniref:DUF1330 domain-containing protein n=1 Tax=Symmachiella dynata TaxID=2527995 RepID=A0A517ZW99_9PLAN|nr:DUF1330 domain-containing protein [Symmachiella dynata]QDU46726.1 hypothetical protein Mal52_52480 [Symmachiella dynata]
MSDTPIYMLNVLWFQPDGGAARYREYLKASWPVAKKYGGEKLESYIPEANVIGELDADLIFMVRWPDQSSFDGFIADPEFQAVQPLREAAITNSLLIRCRRDD